ncbi:MAG: NTP transferase domain-containing protein [Burkholderiaceae bacterium]
MILAAGAGSRMGHVPKCLIHADGKTLLERLLGALTPLQACETVLVVGHHGQAIERALAGWPLAQRVRCVTNPAPDESPAGSLRLALGALPSAALHPVMVVLADQPLLTARDLTAVWLAYQARAR